MQPTQQLRPEVGKTYMTNIPDKPEIRVRVRVDELVEIPADPVLGYGADFVAICSFPDEPDAPGIELVPEDWAAWGFSLA